MRFRTVLFLANVSLAGLLAGCDVDPAGQVNAPGTSNGTDNPAPAPTPLAISYPHSFRKLTEPQDNPTTVQGVALGRMLFYEKKLSGDNTMTCASCHQQEHAFTDAKAVSQGINGISGGRSAMSLANSAWYKAYMWDGSAATLEEQALQPIKNPIEMNARLEDVVSKLQNTAEYPQKFKLAFGSEKITAENIGKALAQFQRTLVSAGSKFDEYEKTRNPSVFSAQEWRGYQLFTTHPNGPGSARGANCGDCHGRSGTLDFELQVYHNNGLDASFRDPGRAGVTGDAADRGRFKVPTLRNIALTAPYMHDGRFTTLRQVLEHYNEHVKASSTISPDMSATNNDPLGEPGLGLTPQEIDDVLAFLQTLTDTAFIHNKQFSDPFKK